MKPFRKAFTLHGLATGLLAVMTSTLFPSCSNSMFEPDPAPAVEVTESSESIVKFATIGEFESMTAADIPGDYAGNELKSLQYECVDTIELRALRFNVTAQLTDAYGKSKEVRFTADVGPELVSVEYYPGGEMQEPHHNIETAYYPKVERYRNYSDGSRIGPDLFYGYGHPVNIGCANIFPSEIPGCMSWDRYLIEIWDDYGNLNPDYVYYENGWYCTHIKSQLKINVNYTKIGVDGKKYSGEDLLLNKPSEFYNESFDLKMAWFESFKTDFYGIDEFSGYNKYIFSSGFSDDELEIVNLCKDVKDVSANVFPYDSHNLRPGFYYGSGSIDAPYNVAWTSVYNSDQSEYKIREGIVRNTILSFYLQYLVIDGRIIHFNDILNYKYLGRDVTVTNIPNGYYMRHVDKHSIFGYNIKLIDDMEIIKVNGPQIISDDSDYRIIDENDDEELNQLNGQSSKIRSDGGQSAGLPRNDGNRMKIDRTLPQSIRSVEQSRTINLRRK